MKLILAKTAEVMPGSKLMKLAGFIYIVDRMSGKGSYSRPLGRYHYPRFHSYIEENDSELVINLHLDQKQASYEGFSRHSGEYDGEAVAGEIQRIKAVAEAAGYREKNRSDRGYKPTPVIANPQSAERVAVRPLGAGDFRQTLLAQEAPKKSWWQKLFG